MTLLKTLSLMVFTWALTFTASAQANDLDDAFSCWVADQSGWELDFDDEENCFDHLEREALNGDLDHQVETRVATEEQSLAWFDILGFFEKLQNSIGRAVNEVDQQAQDHIRRRAGVSESQ